VPSELSAAVAEGVEAEFMYQYVSNAPTSTREDLGIATTRLAGGVVMSVRDDQSGYWTKTLGLGFAEPVTAGLVDRVLDFYRAEGRTQAVVQIAPSVLPEDWDEIRARHELSPDATLIKLTCPVKEFRADGHTDLRVERVDDARVDQWARVTLQGFGMPENLAEMMAAGVRSPGFHPFAVWDGDQMVATAVLFIRGDVASLNAATTLSTHRKRGAQSALLVERAKHAAQAGCRWIVAEAEQPARGTNNPSLNNMLRAGLRPLYSRVNWTWQPAA